MISVNLFDSNNPETNKCFNIYWPECLKEIEYIRPPRLEFPGVSLFTDELCFHPIVDQVKSKYKIAWAMESPVIKPHVYNHIESVQDKFDYILLSNESKFTSSKYKKMHFGCCWITEPYCKLYDKTKMLSIVASNKTWTVGHKLRHEVISKKLHPELELWGSGYNWFSDLPQDRVKPFEPYRYSIVIENCQYPGYFTDKIIDCFATGTIPIYWGDPEMFKHFDIEGYYRWNSITQLKAILDRISVEDYNYRRAHVVENYNRFRNFASPDKNLIKLFTEILI